MADEEPVEAREQAHRARARGVAAAIFAAALFALMAFLVHLSQSRLPSGELLAARGLTGVLLLLPKARAAGIARVASWDARDLWARCFAGATSVACFFWTLQHTSVAGATALADAAPLFVLAFSVPLLRERPQPSSVALGLAAVAGAVLAHRPCQSSLSIEVVVVGLVGACTGGLAYVSLRRAAARYERDLIVWSLSLTLLVGATLGTAATWVAPNGTADVIALLGVGVLGLLAQQALTEAYSYLPAAVVSTLMLLGLPIGLVLDLLSGDPFPPATEVVGYLLVLAAGAAMVRTAGTPPATGPRRP